MRNRRQNLSSIFLTSLIAVSITTMLSAMPTGAYGGDIFVGASGSLEGDSAVGEYTTSGTTVNPSLITGLSATYLIAVSGSNVFTANLCQWHGWRIHNFWRHGERLAHHWAK